MNIIITSSKLQYKANDGGVTRRIPEHFVKRSVFFEVDGEERRIDISKIELPISASEVEVITYIKNNIDESTMVNEKYIEIQNKLLNADEKYLLLNKSDILIEDLRQAKIEQLKYLCEQSIYEGFVSTVIKENVTLEFGFNTHDQNNMTQQTLLVVSTGGNYTSPIYWKTKNLGVIELTVAEFNQIINDATNHKVSQQNKYWQLESQVIGASDIRTIDSINW